MAERILYPEFRDELEPTKYPFADDATLVSDNTSQEIDRDTFLDASVYPIGAGAGVYVSNITVTPRKITITLGDNRSTNLAVADFDPLNPKDVLLFEDSVGRPAGVIVSEVLRLSRFTAWESGSHDFSATATPLVASCVIPTPEPGVRGFVTEDGELFTGDVWIVGENGVVVSEDGDCNVRIDMVGDPLFVRKLCFPLDLFVPPLFVKTINGCTPDANGNYNLTIGGQDAPDEETIIRINPTDTGLKIEAIGQLVRTAE